MITAKIIKDSINAAGNRITTVECVYPRFIHAELLTHRAFSRNAASSRAIPIAKMMDMVRANMAYPIHWGANQAGMQAHTQLDKESIKKAKIVWEYAAKKALQAASDLAYIGVHKQVVNRILEPFQHITTLITATEWDNFFALRDHPDAQPEIQALARAIRKAMAESTPELLQYCEWHIPYIYEDEADLTVEQKVRISVARCARVSYKTHDGQRSTVEADLKLYDRLVGSKPLHASPAEHQAVNDHPVTPSNFRGWIQYRSML